MSAKKLLLNIICVILCISLVSAGTMCNAAVLAFETQYDYDSANIAWLTDLSIKSDLNTVGSAVTPLTLVANSDYPYTETAESFSRDVDEYVTLYSLTQGDPKAAYLYFFELLASVSGTAAGEVTDSDIGNYLVNQGITMPSASDDDSRVVARAIYVAMITGTISNVAPGASLDEVAVNFVAKLSGSDTATIKSWMPSGADFTLDEYLLAASRFALWSAGYDVTAETDEETVYKYIAAMSIEQCGIAVDASSDFDTLRLKFLAAMLGEKYEVSLDWATLGDAVEADSIALYVLKAIGKKYGIAVGSRNIDDAFTLVAENTDVFKLEKGEFYADIFNYDVYVAEGTSKIWINPEPYNNQGTVVVTANDKVLKNSYYTEFAINDTAETQLIKIVVTSVLNQKTATCTYNVTVHSGGEVPAGAQTNTALVNAIDGVFLSSETLLAGVLANINMDTTNNALFAKTFTGLDSDSKIVLSAIAPTFGGEAEDAAQNQASQEYCLSFLDKIGKVIDSDISGINGLDVLRNFTGDALGNTVTFG